MRLTASIACVIIALSLSAARVAADPLRTDISALAWRADLAFLARYIANRNPAPFAHVSKQQFDAAVEDLDRRIPTLDPNQIVMGFQRIEALLEDGHTTLPLFFNGSGPQLGELGFHQFPIEVRQFSDGWFVTDGSEEYRAIVGGHIISIGGVPIESVVRTLTPYVSHDNQFTILARLPYYLRIPEILQATGAIPRASQTPIVVDVGGHEIQAVLRPGAASERLTVSMRDATVQIPLRERDSNKVFWMTTLADGTIYVAYNQVGDMPDETFEHFCGRLLTAIESGKPKRVVIDVRRNGGGSGDLNAYLLNVIARAPQIDTPQSLYVLIGRDTFSAAQLAVDDFDLRTNALFIGEPTGARPNHYGDARHVRLPNSHLDVAVSTVFHQEAGSFEYRDFTPPQINAPLSSEDERRGADPALGALGSYVPFADVAKSAITTLNVEEYLADYERYRSQPQNAYANLLFTNTRFARALFDARRYRDAVQVSGMGLRDYPRSVVFTGDAAFKVLASAYEALGQTSEAIATYKRWLQYDAYNPDAIAGLERLECSATPCNLRV